MDTEKKLKNRRSTVRNILNKYITENRDGSKYAAEYEQLTEKLNAMGHRYTITKDYYCLKYWEDKNTSCTIAPTPHPTTDTLNVINIVCAEDHHIDDIVEFACGLGLSKYNTSRNSAVYKFKAYKSSDEMNKIKDIIKLFVRVTRSANDADKIEIF